VSRHTRAVSQIILELALATLLNTVLNSRSSTRVTRCHTWLTNSRRRVHEFSLFACTIWLAESGDSRLVSSSALTTTAAVHQHIAFIANWFLAWLAAFCASWASGASRTVVVLSILTFALPVIIDRWLTERYEAGGTAKGYYRGECGGVSSD
jgi:hypothetical protein